MLSQELVMNRVASPRVASNLAVVQDVVDALPLVDQFIQVS